MLVKLVSGSDPADFQLIDDVAAVKLDRNQAPPVLHVERRDHSFEHYVVTGSVYMMNDAGKTVDQFTVPRG